MFVLVAEAAGLIGLLFMGSIDNWYVTLQQPTFSPPSWLFVPVWTILYALMGIAAYLVWRQGEQGKSALHLYWTQLVANAVWTPLFFGLHSPAWALADIFLLLVLILATTVAFARVSRAAALLVLPYLAWVCFASVLNFAIWTLNS